MPNGQELTADYCHIYTHLTTGEFHRESSRCLKKIFCSKVEKKVETFVENRFFIENRTFCPTINVNPNFRRKCFFKSRFLLSKVEIFVKYRNFGRNFCEKSKFWPKIENFVKNRNISRKSKLF